MLLQVLFSCLFMMSVQGLPQHSRTATFDLHVTEKGTLFKQNIETDIINDVIYYHTPAHNDLDEMYKVQDFNHNIEVSCYPSKLECYKTYIDRAVFQDATDTTESLVKGYKVNGNKISSAERASVFIKKWFKKGIIADLNLLHSKSAQEFVKGFGFTLFEVGIIPDNAEFLIEDTNVTTGNRRKRELVTMDCKHDVEPVHKYAFTTTTGCDWLHVCKANIHISHEGSENHVHSELECPSTHVKDRMYWSCLCCPEFTYKNQCKCQSMLH